MTLSHTRQRAGRRVGPFAYAGLIDYVLATGSCKRAVHPCSGERRSAAVYGATVSVCLAHYAELLAEDYRIKRAFVLDTAHANT